MFFKKKSVEMAQLSVEQVRFSNEDLFCLLGGIDSCMVACNSANMALQDAAEKISANGEWRRTLINRYQGSGWVDNTGTPNDELARALEPLKRSGIAIADSVFAKDRRIGFVFSDDCAGGVVRMSGRNGGYCLRTFPQDKSLWSSRFREIMTEDVYPFGPAQCEVHATIVEGPNENFMRACNKGDTDFARNSARFHGFDEDFAAELAHAVGGSAKRFLLYVNDFRDTVPGTSRGWRNVAESTGHYIMRRAFVVPVLGAVISGYNGWHAGVPEDWILNPKEWKEATTYISVDSYPSGDLYEALTDIKPYPQADD